MSTKVVKMIRIASCSNNVTGSMTKLPVLLQFENSTFRIPSCYFANYHQLLCSPVIKAPSVQHQQIRHFIPTFPNPFTDKTKGGKKLQYSECHLLGYSMAQMFDIVSKVELYPEFVPWCKESVIMERRNTSSFRCKLVVGFPPLLERYNSLVTMSRPHLVKSECTDGILFNELLTIWRFGPGLDDRPDTCTLKFFVSFEFRSSLHTRLAQAFFDEVVRTMVDAFLKRARKLHGPQSIKPQRKTLPDAGGAQSRS